MASCPTSQDPPDPTNAQLDKGALITCGGNVDPKCCYSRAFADRACKKAYGDLCGYSNVHAELATPSSTGPVLPNCPIGQPYECRADITPMCPSRDALKYNKDAKFGMMQTAPYAQQQPLVAQFNSFCQSLGPNSNRMFADLAGADPTKNTWNQKDWGQCVIGSWTPGQLYPDTGSFTGLVATFPNNIPSYRGDEVMPSQTTEPLEDCCNPVDAGPAKEKKRVQVCSPQTCFGKKACDTTNIVKQICSDKDNIATDNACVDTCIRLNKTGSQSWCNVPIQTYCQGKNLETEGCRRYCSADNIDLNPQLASFCDNAYVNYCSSKDPSYDEKRQKQLCGCINSRLPSAICVDAACTNQIAVTPTKQRQILKSGCPDICQQNIFVDAKGNAVIQIDDLNWSQICPNTPPPGSNPDNPWAPPGEEKGLRLGWYIGVPALVVLIVLVLVFLFR
jgi:hypothetical protein